MEKEKFFFTCLHHWTLMLFSLTENAAFILTSQADNCNQWQTVKIRKHVYLEAMEKSCCSTFCEWKAVGNGTKLLAVMRSYSHKLEIVI